MTNIEPLVLIIYLKFLSNKEIKQPQNNKKQLPK